MKIFRMILIGCIFAFSFLLLFEFLARGFFYLKHGFTFSESFLYEPDEMLRYKINSKYKGQHGKHYLGIRNDYFRIEKGDKVRIVCLGASTTYGHAQLDSSNVWPAILECLLNGEKNRKYEVLNAGVAGYGSSNLAARLKKDILNLNPDIIIIFTGWNLVGSLKSKYGWVPDNIYFREQPFLKKLNNFLINNSLLYVKMSNIIAVEDSSRQKNIIDEIYRGELPIFAKDIEEIITICRHNNIVPVLIKYPAENYNYRRYRDTVKLIEEIASANNVHLIDCSSYFKTLDKREMAQYFVDIAHFSDKGNEKMAELIYNYLINNKLIL